MSDAISPKRSMLCIEGLKTFRAHWREWSKTAVWFFVITTMGYIVMALAMSDPAMQEIQKMNGMIKPGQSSLTPEQAAASYHVMMKMFVYALPMVLVVIVQTYVFLVFFMRKQKVFGAPQASIVGFFSWMLQYILLVLVLGAIGLVAFGIPMGLGTMLGSSIPGFVIFLVSFAGFVFFYFMALRLYPVMLLSVCKIKPLYKTSWILMKGNCWRLIGNILLLMFMLLIVWVAAVIVIAIAGVGVGFASKMFFAQTDGKTFEHGAMIFSSIMAGVALTAFNGVLWAFYCTALCIFYEKKHAADPTFVLTSTL